MAGKRKLAVGVVLVAVLGGTLFVAHRFHLKREPTIFVLGSVIRQDTDPRKQVPIADVEISAADDLAASDCRSDSSGFFRLPLLAGTKPGQSVTLLFNQPEYDSQKINAIAGNKIYVVRMVPIPTETKPPLIGPEVVVANVGVRYSLKTTALVNVGSIVKTFEVENTGNVPCNGRAPCSPDGRWKAATGSITVDAGAAGGFQNARTSCIAGPCPFTKIDPPDFSQNRRIVKVSARDWSDTATFLVEAEVVRSTVSNAVRVSYPVSFGDALNFTLPAGAEGVCLEAEMNGVPIVFPLGPDLILDWADCNTGVNRDQTKVYRCELKPGYKF